MFTETSRKSSRESEQLARGDAPSREHAHHGPPAVAHDHRAAEHDRPVTPYLSKAIYNVQKKAPSRTDFKLFENRDLEWTANPLGDEG